MQSLTGLRCEIMARALKAKIKYDEFDSTFKFKFIKYDEFDEEIEIEMRFCLMG